MTQELAAITEASKIADNTYDLALAFDIDSPEMFDIAGQELRSIVGHRKHIEELRLSLTRPIDESKRRILELFRAPLDRLSQAESLLRDGMTTFQRADEARQAEARRQSEEAAQAERTRLEQAERDAESARAAATAQAAQAASAGDLQAAAAADALAEQAANDADMARSQRELAEIAPPSAPAQSRGPKSAGIGKRTNWKAEVTDLRALVIEAGRRAAAGDDFLIGLLAANTTAIHTAARALQSRLAVPGIRVYSESSLSVRRRAA